MLRKSAKKITGRHITSYYPSGFGMFFLKMAPNGLEIGT